MALVAMPALVASDEWEQVPSDSGQGAASEGADAVKAPAADKGAMACTLVGALVQQTAKLRDQGVTEQSQLASNEFLRAGGR